jgi:predicted TIM-barrel fold metal-dependent hydrolase
MAEAALSDRPSGAAAAVAGLGAIDCDMNPVVPDIAALMPHLPGHWRDAFAARGIAGFAPLAYPPRALHAARAEWRDAAGDPPAGFAAYARAVADPLGLDRAIANCRYGVNLAMSEDMAAALATAVNDWLGAEWLDADPRMRAGVAIPVEDPERAAEEIDRRAADPRFVQVLLPLTAEAPLGKRRYWPIYAAACRHGLPVAIHPGGPDRHAPTAVGWPTHHVEAVAAQAAAFQGQVASLICEGVFQKFPKLTVVLLESGVTWLAPFLWRLSKFWRGCRSEIPWVDRPPIDIARDHLRLTVAPFDAPAEPEATARALDRLDGAHMLLWASDYPHDTGAPPGAALPGLDTAALRRLARENAVATYPRLGEDPA